MSLAHIVILLACLAQNLKAIFEKDTTVFKTTHGFVNCLKDNIDIKRNEAVVVDICWGIPYAQPPIGDLRFKHSVPAEPWLFLDALKPPPSCMQVLGHAIPVYVPDPSTPVSEDCLYLNIWRPNCFYGSTEEELQRGENRYDPLTTLVFLHGGGYMSGSSTVSSYNGAILAASQCVIVVTLNYRLGALGFMYLAIPDVPGNMGLLDMRLALQWVHDNIHNFGGDHARITIFGQSAGGASSSLFLLSPLTINLFSSAIIQSGSPISHLAQQSTESALETAYELSKIFHCYFPEDNMAIAECLKKVDHVLLTETHFNLVQDYRHFMTAIVDGYFLIEEPKDSVVKWNAKLCPLLLGTTGDEGTFFMGLKWPEMYNFNHEQNSCVTEEELDSMLSEFFTDFLKPQYISSVIKEVKDVYELEELKTFVEDPHLTLLNYVIGDVINICPVQKIARYSSYHSNMVYLYRVDITSKLPGFPSWIGAIHGAEIDYVFGRVAVDKRFSKTEQAVSRFMMFVWANFAKYRKPLGMDSLGSNNSLTFSPLTIKRQQFFKFSTSPRDIKQEEIDDGHCMYWEILPQEYLK